MLHHASQWSGRKFRSPIESRARIAIPDPELSDLPESDRNYEYSDSMLSAVYLCQSPFHRCGLGKYYRVNCRSEWQAAGSPLECFAADSLDSYHRAFSRPIRSKM